MDEFNNKHYIRLDANCSIIKGFSDAFEQAQSGDTCINDQAGRQFEMRGQINPSLQDMRGVWLYKYIDGEVLAKTPEEIEANVPIEPIRQAKLAELSTACENAIYAGVDVDTSFGKKHFNLSANDQNNLNGIAAVIGSPILMQAAEIDPTQGVWYKADGDGETHRYWPVDDFVAIAAAVFKVKSVHLTYYEHLKTYMQGLTDRNEIAAVTYGMTIPTAGGGADA